MSFREAISKTLLISAKKHEDHKIEQQIREIDPNDFEFEETLRNVLEVVQSNKDKVVFVLDNIDRLPPNEINEYWALVRSVFSKSSVKNSSRRVLTAIVPYDRKHILESSDSIGEFSVSDNELFFKTFDEILSVSPPVMSNAKDFFEDKVRFALPDFASKEEFFRVYLIFNMILKRDNGHATPRQIIFFINELSGLYAIHSGSFNLTLIAIYIAHKNKIERNPGVLTQRGFIEEKFKGLATTVEVEKQLAAIFYNVDEELAFQLLLDDRVIKAAESDDSQEIILLSESKGFDIRVSEVVQGAVPEWLETGVYHKVVYNFSQLLSVYDDSAKHHLSKALVNGFLKMEDVFFEKKIFINYLEIFNFLAESDVSNVCQKYIALMASSTNSHKDLDFNDGEVFSELVSELKIRLEAFENGGCLIKTLNLTKLHNNYKFIFGVACAGDRRKVDLSYYDHVETEDLYDTDTRVSPMVIEYLMGSPDISLPVLRQLREIGEMDEDDWSEIFKKLVESLVDEKLDEGHFPYFLEMLLDIWLDFKVRKDESLSLSTLLGDSTFYNNVKAAGSDESVIAQVLFLVLDKYPSGEIPLPSKVTPDGQEKMESTEGYEYVGNLLKGEKFVSDETIKITGKLINSTRWTTALLSYINEHENVLIGKIIKVSCLLNDVPRIPFEVFLTSGYKILTSIMGEDINQFLLGYAVVAKELKYDGLEIDSCPRGLLKCTHSVEGWSEFHHAIESKLQAIEPKKWYELLADGAHEVDILVEKLNTSGVIFESFEFRQTMKRFVLGLLSGRVIEIDSYSDYDDVIQAVDCGYHADFYRELREELESPTTESLPVLSSIFPRIMKNILNLPNAISDNEADLVVRHLICPALEGNDHVILSGMLSMGRARMKKVIKKLPESTEDKLLTSLNVLGKNNKDRKYVESIAKLIKEKKNVIGWFDMFYPPKKEELDTYSEGVKDEDS